MIVGNGLLAKSFKSFEFDDSVLIFASGVSNSLETNHLNFERELTLLNHYLRSTGQLIYFSTISVYDPALVDSPYIIHKKKIEKIIEHSSSSYLIFRLPILVSDSTNENTLTNFLFNKISKKETIPIFDLACRYLMDIQDASFLLTEIIKLKKYANQIIDINFNNPIKIGALVSVFEQALNTKVNRLVIKKGGCYRSNNKEFLNYLNFTQFKLKNDYILKTIEKYYGNYFKQRD